MKKLISEKILEHINDCLYCKGDFFTEKEVGYIDSFCEKHITLPLNRRILIGLRQMFRDFVIMIVVIPFLFLMLWGIWSLIDSAFFNPATQERLSNPLIWIPISILIAGFVIAMAIADRSNKE